MKKAVKEKHSYYKSDIALVISIITLIIAIFSK